MRFQTPILLGSLIVLAASIARADHVESSNGDLSNAFGSPTLITLNPGTNTTTTIIATTGAPGGVIDHDYFRITIPAGFRLHGIRLLNYVGPSQSFLGMQAGTVFTSPGTTTEATLLGYTHINQIQAELGTNLLPGMGTAFGAQGFRGPLPAGNYSFWIQENASPSVSYTLALDVSAATGVPALPTAFGVLVSAGLLFAGLRRSRRFA